MRGEMTVSDQHMRYLGVCPSVVANFGIVENEILACMRLNGSDGSVDSEWQTSANYILVEVGQND